MKKTISYCEKCGKWRGLAQICSDCKVSTKQIPIPNPRGGHYFVQGVPEPLTRVSNIIGIIAKEGLVQWRIRQSVLAALENPLLSIEQAMASPNNIRDKAGGKGTDIHNLIEKDIYDKKLLKGDYLKTIENYESWRERTPHKILFKETKVYSKEHLYGGKFDALIQLENTGEVQLIDYKTGKYVDDKDSILQLSAYKHAILEMKLVEKIDSMAIIHLRPDKVGYQIYEENFEMFLHYKKIYDWNK